MPYNLVLTCKKRKKKVVDYKYGPGEYYYTLTKEEVERGVLVSDYTHTPGDWRRYWADPKGTKDSSSALDAAISGNKYLYLPPSGTLNIGSTNTTNIKKAR